MKASKQASKTAVTCKRRRKRAHKSKGLGQTYESAQDAVVWERRKAGQGDYIVRKKWDGLSWEEQGV